MNAAQMRRGVDRLTLHGTPQKAALRENVRPRAHGACAWRHYLGRRGEPGADLATHHAADSLQEYCEGSMAETCVDLEDLKHCLPCCLVSERGERAVSGAGSVRIAAEATAGRRARRPLASIPGRRCTTAGDAAWRGMEADVAGSLRGG